METQIVGLQPGYSPRVSCRGISATIASCHVPAAGGARRAATRAPAEPGARRRRAPRARGPGGPRAYTRARSLEVPGRAAARLAALVAAVDTARAASSILAWGAPDAASCGVRAHEGCVGAGGDAERKRGPRLAAWSAWSGRSARPRWARPRRTAHRARRREAARIGQTLCSIVSRFVCCACRLHTYKTGGCPLAVGAANSSGTKRPVGHAAHRGSGLATPLGDHSLRSRATGQLLQRPGCGGTRALRAHGGIGGEQRVRGCFGSNVSPWDCQHPVGQTLLEGPNSSAHGGHRALRPAGGPSAIPTDPDGGLVDVSPPTGLTEREEREGNAGLRHLDGFDGSRADEVATRVERDMK